MAELSQLPDVVDLKFVAGDTFRIRVRVIDPGTGVPIAINPDSDATPGEPGEYAFAAWIVDNARATVAQFTVTADVDDPDQAIILTLSPTDTAALPGMGTGTEFQGMWDLEVIFPNEDVRTVAKGSVFCYLDVTHSGLP